MENSGFVVRLQVVDELQQLTRSLVYNSTNQKAANTRKISNIENAEQYVAGAMGVKKLLSTKYPI